MSFIDRTQQFRHGVLIGNWNEDAFGIERVKNPDSFVGLPPSEQYKSVAHASYRRPDDKALHQYQESKLESVDRRAGVGKALISQPNVNPTEQFATTYSSWGKGQAGTLTPDYTLSKQVAPPAGVDKGEAARKENATFSRRISGRTDYRDNFTKEHSLLGLPAGQRISVTKQSAFKQAETLRTASTAKTQGTTLKAEGQSVVAVD